MLEILKNRVDFKEACERAASTAAYEGCAVFVSYVARDDKFKTNDWVDEATVCWFDESGEIKWI